VHFGRHRCVILRSLECTNQCRGPIKSHLLEDHPPYCKGSLYQEQTSSPMQTIIKTWLTPNIAGLRTSVEYTALRLMTTSVVGDGVFGFIFLKYILFLLIDTEVHATSLKCPLLQFPSGHSCSYRLLQQFGIHFVVQIVRLFVQGAVPKLIRVPAVDCVLAQKLTCERWRDSWMMHL
jgi:hypothetical protein